MQKNLSNLKSVFLSLLFSLPFSWVRGTTHSDTSFRTFQCNNVRKMHYDAKKRKRVIKNINFIISERGTSNFFINESPLTLRDFSGSIYKFNTETNEANGFYFKINFNTGDIATYFVFADDGVYYTDTFYNDDSLENFNPTLNAENSPTTPSRLELNTGKAVTRDACKILQ